MSCFNTYILFIKLYNIDIKFKLIYFFINFTFLRVPILEINIPYTIAKLLV